MRSPATYFFPGSNNLTLVAIALLLLFTTLYSSLPQSVAITSLIACSALLIVNFIIAIIRKRILVNKPALLVFHLALIVIFFQLILSQLTYLKATTEVSVNQQFDGSLENIRSGPFHNFDLNDKSFTNLGFQINYLDGVRRDTTINRIQLQNHIGRDQVITIGDHIPLVLGHYRFYTSHNKGYAPIFTWTPKQENRIPVRGSVHLPAYPINEYQQSREWNLPGIQQTIWTMLVIEEDVVPENRDFSFRIPLKHHLIMRIGEERRKLIPGDRIELPDGILRYEYLSSWMGYTVDYDWTRPWLLITSFIGITALFFHYLGTVLTQRKLSFSGK